MLKHSLTKQRCTLDVTGVAIAHRGRRANHAARKVYVTPDGCTYSRAQATGYRPTWHLILNGAAAGLTDAHRRCPSMLGDYQRL